MERRHGSARGHRLRGFTLIEQILVAAIVATLACIAAPALGHLMRRNQLQAAQSDLIVALQTTRALAIHARQRAMLCPTRDGAQCTDELHWEGGWLIGHYRGNLAHSLDGAPTQLDGGHPRLTILSTAGRRRIHFQADGSARGSNASFVLCRAGQAGDALAVTLANAGRVYGSRASAEQAKRCADEG